ncbi:MAG: type II CRISPR-associated endonuclease Cas1 [Enhydrobacter sp.]|nr:type II CRISPR-associated endonuclease Cas1 [Enhydrobacter sp.]
MAWRGLHISKAARLNLADGQVVVAQDDGDVRLALEDIAWIVVDAPHATLTSTLLSACMDNGIALIVTDATHTPSGVTLPFHRHFRQGGMALMQAGMSAPLKKRLWQSTVRAKILNQAAALDAVGCDGAPALRAMARLVSSGDSENVEARAAREYWSCLFASFRREDEGDTRNKMLNYGYAVVRSCVARALVAAGLLPALGINHASATNAFNLADDIVEPFRPFVDVLVWRTSDSGRPAREALTLDHRRAMAAVMLTDCVMAHETMTLLAASEEVSASLVRAIEGGTSEVLELPTIAA